MLSRISVKKPYTVIVGIILVAVLGVISFQHMTTDLLPSMNLPYVVVYTPYIGATPEQVESSLTRPMEAAFATLTDVKKITSSSRDNVSIVVMQFNDGANMDTALIEISSRLDQLRGGWGDDIGAPVTMKLNPDMLPVAILSVTRDDMDILELSDYVEDELVPAFESLNGVASANASGLIQQKIDITIEQARIDALNSAILRDIDAKLADAEIQLNDAQAQLSEGKKELARQKKAILGRIDGAIRDIDKGAARLDSAIEELEKQRGELVKQRDAAQTGADQLKQLLDMDKNQQRAAAELVKLVEPMKQQLNALEAQLDRAEDVDIAPLTQQRDAAQAEKEELMRQRDALKASAAGADSPDEAGLNEQISALEDQVKDASQQLAEAVALQPQLEEAQAALQRQVDDLEARIRAQSGASGAPKEAPDPTGVPAGNGSEPGHDAGSPSDGAENGETPESGNDAPAENGDNPAEGTGESGENPDAPTEPSAETGDAADENAGDTPVPPSDGGDSGEAVESNQAQPGGEPDETGAAQPDAGSDAAVSAQPDNDAASESAASDAGPASEGESGESAPAPAPAEQSSGDDPAPAPEQQPSGDESARGYWGRALAEEGDVERLRAELADARQRLSEATNAAEENAAQIAALQKQIDDANAEIESRKQALEALRANSSESAASADEARREAAVLDARIAALDLEIEGLDALIEQLGSTDKEALKQQIAYYRQRIEELEQSDAYRAAQLLQDPKALKEQYDQARQGVAMLDEGIATIDGYLEKLRQGILPGGMIDGINEDTKLSDARAQLTDARAKAVSGFADAAEMIEKGESELAKARKEFNDKRDEALESAGLDGVITVQMIAGLIGAQNFAMPAGYVYDGAGEQVLIRVGDKFKSIDELKAMKLFELGLDTIDEVRLSDVADVALVDNRDDVFTKLNGSDGILLSFDKQSTYSTADVAETILERARELAEADPNLHIVDLMNQGEYINLVVDSVLGNLIYGGALAILVLLMFLMDWRPTLTVAFSIPVSVVVAFVCMYFTGITLNVLSLSGLSLGIGMLVDNSIVSIENIYRLRNEERVPLLRACVEGVKSVSGALMSSTLTTICVFLPIVFVHGMARDLFADMGLTIAFSLLASLLVAMTVVPMMTSFLMRRSRPKKQRIFTAFQRGYLTLLRGALRAKPLVLLAALALLAWSGMQVPKMGISFMPEVNSRQMSANLNFDEDVTTQQRRDTAMAIMDDMLAIEGIDSVGLMDGSGGLLSGLSGGSGSMSYYILVDEDSGRRNVDIAAEIEAIGVRRGADLSAQASTMDISMLAGKGISVEITGDDIETLQSIARDVAEIARGTEGAVDVSDGLEESVPELRLVVDKEKAIDNGLTTAQVFQFVAQKLAGEIEVTKVTVDGKELTLYVVDGKNADLSPEDLEALEIEVNGEADSKLVRIGDIADARDTSSLSTINRASQRRLVTVSFGIADGYSANLVSDAFAARLNEYQMPAGYRAELAGENETVMDIMSDLVWMVLIAVLLIFLIMVAQFQSFKSPIIVMFTIPLAFTGGLLALLITGMDLSIVGMLGFLVLSGVVVNNGIVFIDCVNQLRIGGMEKKDALLEAGRQRLRPILMTALTTILGISTMALGHGAGAEMMQPMAVVSIGGLSYATLMTLFVVPVLYDIFNGSRMNAREIQMIREAAGMNGDEVLDGETAEATESPAIAPASGVEATPEPESAVEATPEPEALPAAPACAEDDAPADEADEAAPAEAEAPVGKKDKKDKKKKKKKGKKKKDK